MKKNSENYDALLNLTEEVLQDEEVRKKAWEEIQFAMYYFFTDFEDLAIAHLSLVKRAPG